jgi:hypothetical protein
MARGPQLPSDCDVAKIDIMRVCRRPDGNGMGLLRAATGWQPHKVVAASAVTLGITGWIWLWDEVSAP